MQAHGLPDFIDPHDPEAVYGEVLYLLNRLFPGSGVGQFQRVFEVVQQLFQGQYPGYQACNTQFHDFKHTMGCLLALIRLIHGAMLKDQAFSSRSVLLTLISALMHDTGYLQLEEDRTGTGAKYTLVHVQRSVNFMETYFKQHGYQTADFAYCKAILLCTGLEVNIDKIVFVSKEHEILGKMLGTADLLGQMGDRDYLKKIVFLYYEFEEGKVPGFASEFDLLKKTPGFYEMCKARFETELGGVNHYMRDHFHHRLSINRDLYRETIERTVAYLQYLVDNYPRDYRQYLRRSDLMNWLQDRFA